LYLPPPAAIRRTLSEAVLVVKLKPVGVVAEKTPRSRSAVSKLTWALAEAAVNKPAARRARVDLDKEPIAKHHKTVI